MLLNAKRNLTGKEDVYVYVDLTNSFSDARECFRYIIDIAIETHIDKLKYAYDDIVENRKKTNIPDHLEHVQELRKLLLLVRGKIVIILDEIDALTKVLYSDVIFKQIRSTYFSRVNFPELERLTYVLSGVAEPSNLIKDPKISPFNIGQNILLGDFDHDEFLSFIEKSKLNIGTTEIERIFHWTNGNPRMSFEVCSNLEDKLLSGFSPSSSLIDDIVQTLYLQKFDLAPIDHIREIVENDSEIHNAVVFIKNGDSDKLTSSIRRKLYLSGIIGSDFEENQIFIKNRIIDAALSNEWLDEVSIDYLSVVNKSNLLLTEGFFQEGMGLLEKALETATGEAKVLYRRILTSAYYSNKFYGQVVELFNQYPEDFSYIEAIDKRLIDSEVESIRHYAFSLFNTGEYASAIRVFQILQKFSNKDLNYYQSLLFVAIAHLQLESEDKYSNAQHNLLTLIDELNEPVIKLTPSQVNEFRTLSFFNLGKLAFESQDKATALVYFNKASDISIVEWKPNILYFSSLLVSKEHQNALLLNVITIIIENHIKPQLASSLRTLSVNYDTISKILELAKFNGAAEMVLRERFIDHIVRNDPQRFGLSSEKILNDSYLQGDSNEELLGLLYIYGYIYKKNIESVTLNNKAFIYKIFRNAASEELIISFGRYFVVELLTGDLLPVITSEDVPLIWITLKSIIDNGEYELAKQIIAFVNSFYPTMLSEERTDYLMVDFFEMVLLNKVSNNELLFQKAKKVLHNFNTGVVNPQHSHVMNKEVLEVVRNSAQSNYSKLAPIYENKDANSGRKRNTKVTVKYTNGKIVTDKYKRLSDDINSDLCQVIT